jgi:hypothetical protein
MREKFKQWNSTRGPRPLAPRWVAFVAGLCFAIPGLWDVVSSVPKSDKFATRTCTASWAACSELRCSALLPHDAAGQQCAPGLPSAVQNLM